MNLQQQPKKSSSTLGLLGSSPMQCEALIGKRADSNITNHHHRSIPKFIYLSFIVIFIIFITNFSGNFLVSGENLRVFLIPHSHIDQGWLRTVREYQSETFSILDSIINQMLEKSHLRYVWGDVLYFKEWFEQQPAPRQQKVKKLIKTNRFEFVGGGWIQTDEACASYTSIINSMTVGHEYLLRRFGVRPRVAWQIDPFGHDGKIPQIFSQMGFDALVINRVHFSIKSVMKDEKALEFIWNISPNSTIFTEVLHTHYSSPRNFDFEKPGVEYINDQNVERKAHEFIEDMKKRSNAYRTPYILVPMGDDFKFRDAGAQFSNMDRIIDFLDKHDMGVKVQYATTGEYFSELFKAYGKTTKFPVVKQDFMPYADYPDSYWTGYFTSLPNLKKSARTAESILTSTEMLYALARVKMTHQNTMFNWVDTFNSIQRSRQTVGLVQHHDAITGTCRKHVYNDYMSQLASVIQDMKSLHKSLTQHVLEIDKASVLSDSLNVNDDDQHSIIIYNSLSHNIKQIVTVNSKCSLASVLDSAKNPLDYQVIPNVGREKSEIPLPFSIQFVASVDGLAFNSYTFKCKEHSEGDLLDTNVLFVNKLSKHYEQFNSKKVQVREISSAKEIVIENSHYVLTFDKGTGYVKSVTSKRDGKIHETVNQFLEYKTQNSGSYLFRPNEGGPSPLGSQNLEYVYISRGPVVDKAIINTDRVIMTITLPHELNDETLDQFIDYRFEINPLPENSETVVRFGVATKDDSAGSMIVYDGYNFVKRTIHKAAPKPGKFFPSTSGALLKFPDSQISVLTDHTMAVTANGRELEFLVHRRLMRDDMRGMAEANNDQSSLKFRVSVSYLTRTTNDDFVKLHQKSLLVNRQPQTYVFKGKVLGQFNIFSKKFPPTAQIISLQARGISSDEVAIRLQNLHPSKPLTIDFGSLFSEGVEVSDLRERSLNLIYEVNEEKKKLRFKKDAVMRFDFTKQVQLKGEGGQNTDQEGVFLSDEAIAEMEKQKNIGRKPLSIGGISTFTIVLPPTEIKSYFAAMTFSGKGFVPISKKDSDEDTENKEINDLGLEDDEAVEENEMEEDIRTVNDEENKINIIGEENNEPKIPTINKVIEVGVPRPPREKIPFWVFVIIAILIAICGFCCLSLTLMMRRRGRKERPTVLPMFHQDNAGIKTK